MPHNTPDMLRQKGWVLIQKVKSNPSFTVAKWHAWHHPDHQHEWGWAFTLKEAIEHQGQLDKGETCLCTPHEFTLHPKQV